MISVIIPVYNTEKYLRRCVDSILAQTFIDYEAIFIDDGSIDSSGVILDNYQKVDSRIKVYHQNNQGASKARSYGVSQAKGEWVTFVDSDDTLPPNTLLNYSHHLNDNTDIVIGWLNDYRYEEDFLSIDEYRRRNISRYGIVVGPPTHIYRRSILTPYVFDIPREIVMGEDMLMNIRVAFNTNRPVSVTHHFVYNYDVAENKENATNSFRTSMEYEYKYHQLRLKSIPVECHQKYMKEMVGIRTYELLRYIDAHPFDKTWRCSDFFKELQRDMEAIDYKTNRANMMLLSTNSRLMQYLLIIYKRQRTRMIKSV